MKKAEPLRILDVPNADGGQCPDSWVLISQKYPFVCSRADKEVEWSNKRSDALLLSFHAALAVAQQRTSLGDRVALVRNNAASWEWLMLVADWGDVTLLG